MSEQTTVTAESITLDQLRELFVRGDIGRETYNLAVNAKHAEIRHYYRESAAALWNQRHGGWK